MVAVVETLIGKGATSASSIGTSRRPDSSGQPRYIEQEIPHVASLMCSTVDALLDHAESS